MTENDTATGTDPVTDTDDERLLDSLLEEGLLLERPDGTLSTSEAFEATHNIYRDSYGDVSDDVFQQAVSDVFDLSPANAAERIEAAGVTREMLVTYLSVQSELDGSYSTAAIARMATMVGGVSPDSPIPDAVESLDDETYEAFLSENARAVVTVWKHHCEPCAAVKDALPSILDALPEDVAVGGVDGEAVPAFRRAFEVNAAPSLLLFADGSHLATFRGRFTADEVAEAAERHYD